jgi:hypothetical protein
VQPQAIPSLFQAGPDDGHNAYDDEMSLPEQLMKEDFDDGFRSRIGAAIRIPHGLA